jgi:hypothetical protein
LRWCDRDSSAYLPIDYERQQFRHRVLRRPQLVNPPALHDTVTVTGVRAEQIAEDSG